ncbi:MAG: Glycosyl transferase group 1 [Acetothermia bacterium 64_32]|nr:MAG: Glycosyl transferase group 1 [Acetothermia bacterium 64_32]MBC7097554.1 glycosyltransferase [Candidatus Bipolaricaulota bacterium]HAF71119.1 hypothetical protein [Candidatus Acetothermia bacterium]
MRIGFVSTYPPQKCGIATFTEDLARAVGAALGTGPEPHIRVVALEDVPCGYPFGPEVGFRLRRWVPGDYREAAAFLDEETDVVSLQHTFGIYGGPDGELVLELLEHLHRPVVTTFHTVRQKPTPAQRELLHQVAGHSDYVVVMARRGVEFLERIYHVPRRKVRFIHHGAPDVPYGPQGEHKEALGLASRPLILTFGLIRRDKGIEEAIRALRIVKEKGLGFLYVLLGETHPAHRRAYGEGYREELKGLVEHLGLGDSVRFEGRFVDRQELLRWLLACDIYLIPYPNLDQITSGTLTYALACGRCVVSTPFWHAQELLAEGRGVLVPPQAPDDMARAIVELLGCPERREGIQRRAYSFGRSMIWPVVGKKHLELLAQAAQKAPHPYVAQPG